MLANAVETVSSLGECGWVMVRDLEREGNQAEFAGGAEGGVFGPGGDVVAVGGAEGVVGGGGGVAGCGGEGEVPFG